MMERVIRRSGSPAQALEQEAVRGRRDEFSSAAQGGIHAPLPLAAGGLAGLHQTIGNQAVAQMVRSSLPAGSASALQRKSGRSGSETASRETEETPGLAGTQRPKLAAVGSAASDIHRSPAGSNVIQRTLISYRRAGGSGGITESRPKPADLGDANTIFMEYARLLYDDSSAIVEGKQGLGNPGLVSVMKDRAVTASEISKSFIDGLVSSGDWKFAPAAWMDDLRTAIATEYPEMNTDGEVDGWTDQETIEYCETDADEILSKWLTAKTSLAGTKVSEIITSAAAFAAQWKTYLAYVLYEAVKGTFYPIEASSDFKPFVQPFIELIGDVNAGRITELKFVEKYGAVGNRGAEFQVEEPGDLKDKYENIAVVHTHYADDDSPPNYGHTKPYANRYDAGYGYTRVNVDRLNAMDDTQKTYNEL